MHFPKSKIKQRCAKLVLFLNLEKHEQLSPAFSYRANALQARAARERVLQDDEDEDDSELDASMSSLEEAQRWLLIRPGEWGMLICFQIICS